VEEFSQDIGRHLRHVPVKARPSTLAYRTSKFVRRHRIEVGAAGLVLFVLAAAGLLAFNVFGLRERILSSISSGRIQSRNTTPRFNPKGWVFAGAPGAKPAASCESLVNLQLPDTTITSTQSVAAGNFTPAGADPIQRLPAFCRVEGVVKPTKDSDIRFEVWVPSSDWNGVFHGVGNGGFAGSINFDEMAAALRSGYATASTDTGHRGGVADATWALRHPEKVVDFGYRGIHEMTVKAKDIIRVFYGQAPHLSFFEGCSNGGRAALMEAERFPEDYDGILAGSPDNPWTTVLAVAFYNTQVPGLKTPASYIPATKIPAISGAVLAACDAQDGVTDGILNDPRQCHFDPSVLLCHGPESDSCLTSAQITQLKRIYAGLRNSRGEQVLPGYLPGGEEGEGGWKPWITGPSPGQSVLSVFGLAYFPNLVFDNPRWDYRTVSMERAIAMAEAKNARVLDATDPDLRPFQARGGKLILYNGWSEPAVPALVTTNQYDSIVAKLGSQDTENFVRLYMAPGMQHCYGGPGPNFFGQFDLSLLGPNPPSTNMDPQHNISSALEQWLEKGVAPGPIIATKFVNDLDPSQGVKMTRPLCPYPQIAKYKGTGDTNDAANFVCVPN
jgi:hypothetical protein